MLERQRAVGKKERKIVWFGKHLCKRPSAYEIGVDIG